MENTQVPEVFLDFSSCGKTQEERKIEGKPLEPWYMEKPNFAISSLLSVKL